MGQRTDTYDLAQLRLTTGEGRRIEALSVPFAPLDFGGTEYVVAPAEVPVVLDVSRMTGGGYSMRLRFEAALEGPCMRCLEPAAPLTEVDAREIDVPGETVDDLTSPYMDGEELDVHAWARDAYSLALPRQVVCRPDCAGLCPECGIDLNHAPADHAHDRGPDPRWAALRELDLGATADEG